MDSRAQAGNQFDCRELIPSTPVMLPFTATLPADALGDEDGYIEVTATLASDSSVQTTSWIPIEALRTRGLSLVGPTGLASSEGFGIPGYTAETYVLIENLGTLLKQQHPSIGPALLGVGHQFCSMVQTTYTQLHCSPVKRRK